MSSVDEAILAAWQVQQAGSSQQAERMYRDILAGIPSEDHHKRAEVESSLGISLATQGRFAEAIASFEQALQHRPEFPEAHNNLGNVLVMQNRQAEAEACYQRALSIRSDYHQAHCNLGVAYLEQGKLDLARTELEEALRLDPQYIDAHVNLGNTFRQSGNLEAALAQYQRALQMSPQQVDAHWNRALAWLMMGNYERGWPEYEWRWLTTLAAPRGFTTPLWDGSPLDGRTILLYAEQGLGDTLQFLRYVPLVKRYGGRVVVECQAPLSQLLSGFPGIDQLVPQGDELPPHDVQYPLMSLALFFRSSIDTLPDKVPYLFPRPDLVAKWSGELSADKEFKIGIAWQGNRQFRDDVHRSIPLQAFAPLAKVPGVRLYSLQKGFGVEQIGQVAGEFSVVDLGSRLDEQTGPFLDTAAAMQGLDLIISANTVAVHLAGAMGRPTWLALSTNPEWRWMLGREDSPWYPTLRIFRQRKLGDWNEVFERMAHALQQELRRQRPKGQSSVEIATGELIDKITILEIKSERITDPAKLHNVQEELRVLAEVRDSSVVPSRSLTKLTAELKKVNEELWEVEDQIRDREREKDFGDEFIRLARSVYRHNDRRAKLKRQINELAGSHLVEEKSYAAYE